MIRFLWIFILVVAFRGEAVAHELRPGFLEIQQTSEETYTIRFKVPAKGDMRLSLKLRLPETCNDMRPSRTERTGRAFLDHRSIKCSGGLEEKDVFIDGLASTFTDVIARVSLMDGSVQVARLTPDLPRFTVSASPTWVDTAHTYFLLGLMHILFGYDHLLFVFALLLLIRDPWMLVKTITAFTLAHSITLAAAALGWASVPQSPIEAVIALSIVFVAAEIVRPPGGKTDLASRAPWLVAFVFGLLHGFGFGGALNEIGLPQTDVPLALLTFNLGVEAGQLAFIAAVLAVKFLLDQLLQLELPWLRFVTGYGIGCIAAFWFAERISAFV